ncbi:ribosomal RNA small subunit methyltransferase A [Candidatus Peregrinibacteria bacterium]|nr:ribosomal RNA small subunit methyltransferase A [Candidatus Peregrinibacteria bacterium]
MIDFAYKKTVINFLKSQGTKAKKHFSQNFLVNHGTLNKIITAANLTTADVALEIGCGLGVLTAELARHAGSILVFEKDRQMISLAKQNLAEYKNISFIESDVLNIPPPNQLYKLVANIPYAITTPILTHFLLAKSPSLRPKLAVLMLQKEVAEKITAQPPHMNLLAILVQVFGIPKIIATIPASHFYPSPKIDSAILKIDMHNAPAVSCDTEKFFSIVRAAFNQKRKILASTLTSSLKRPKAEIQNTLHQLNINPLARPENLSIVDWDRLVNISSNSF